MPSFLPRCSLDTDHYMKSLAAFGSSPRSSESGKFLKRLVSIRVIYGASERRSN